MLLSLLRIHKNNLIYKLMRIGLLLKILLLSILLVNCDNTDKDVLVITPEPEVIEDQTEIENFSDNFGDIVHADFFGIILNQNKEALSNVMISIGNLTTITDVNGIFSISNASVFSNFAYIKASKENFINGSRTMIPLIDEINRLEIIMLEKNIIDTVNSGEIKDVQIEGGGKVTLQGKYITDSGEDYIGAVEVSMHYLAPSDFDTYSKMPGSLLGALENNTAVILETYGMLGINLFSPSGESLNINSNSPATIEIPIDISQISMAPNTIPLWFFDDTLGYWVKEGEAVKQDGKYIGEVRHFSFWNCDDFDNSVNLCVNIKNTDNIPLANTTVLLKVQNMPSNISSGITSISGSVCGIVPLDEILILQIYMNDCNGEEVVYEDQIGPFSSNSTIDISTNIGIFKNTTISGTIIDCTTEESISNGYIYFVNNNNSFTYPLNNGVFQFEYLYCLSEIEATLVGYNLDTNTETEIFDFTIVENETNLGEVNTCDTSIIIEEDDNIFNGDVYLENQSQINDFENLGYTKITGNLIINDNGDEPITNINALQSLMVVEGDLEIKYNSELFNLFGLQNLERVEGSLIINTNSNLNNMEALGTLSVIGNNFVFYNNNSATQLLGLEKIISIPGNLDIAYNEQLISLNGLNSLEEIQGSFHLGSSPDYGHYDYENPMLSDISALENLTHIGENIRLYGLPSLPDFSGLNNLEDVGNDFYLSLEGDYNIEMNDFTNLHSIGGKLFIIPKNVTDISGFNSLQNIERLDIVTYSLESTLSNISGFNSLANGNIAIEYSPSLLTITGFQNIENADNILIRDNPVLTSITGFNSLKTVNGLFSLSANASLVNITGFSSLEHVMILSLHNCPSMTDLNGFSSLSSTDAYVKISEMAGLTDLTGLNSLITINGRLNLTQNQNLTSLAGINNLTTIGLFLKIKNCDSLVSLDGLQGLTSIGSYMEIHDNDSLLNLNGLDNLLYVGNDIRIGVFWNVSSLAYSPNINLSDFCALQNLFANGSVNGGYVHILNNAYNPTRYDIANGDCSQ